MRLISPHEKKIINAALNRERVRQNNCYFNEHGQLWQISKSDVEMHIKIFDNEIMRAAQDELQWRTFENYKDDPKIDE